MRQHTFEEALAARRAGIEKVERGTDRDWADRALNVIKQVAQQREEITADEIWGVLEEFGDTPREPRALGPIFTRAAKLNWIIKTNKYTMSSRAINHGRDIRVWRSNLREPNGDDNWGRPEGRGRPHSTEGD